MKLPCTHIKNSHIAIGRFTEATRLRRYRYAVAEQTDYYPYGMPMADVNSASAQPFKFGGKELEREGGADFYDFEARRLDFALGRFTSPDPLCEQTPEVSPYAYCAADPVNFIDPTGMTIYVNGTLYTIGMEYKGDESFTRQIVTILNLIAENGGTKLLQDLQTSSKQYNYVQSKNGQPTTTPIRDSSGECIGTYMYIATDGYNEVEVTGYVAHESMHAAQYEHGVGGPYIINEVEAYGFERFIGINIGNKNPSYMYLGGSLLPEPNEDGPFDEFHTRIANRYADPNYKNHIEEYESILTRDFVKTHAYVTSKRLYSAYNWQYPMNRKQSLYRYYTNQ